ncbi:MULTISPECIES: LysE family translocator [Vibrio]|jgi:threonine efflux protein|uniref:Threonine transporter n=4 Tax=Vibrio TaxID=662 RepID=A0A7Z1ME23_9VIBR|nr:MULTISPECIES: LysE family translocator [Vibrio]KNH11683.1 threonine transporter [Vibrio lentus]MBY7663239.1 LysE family translocator [Vibrio atlanticus]ERM58957.1 Arginine exporter protein ArgO [Vibrio cyclitrophicus FF75]KAA8596211.1 L-lysine permease [Vibrio cyclitrophicus]MBE8558650.1 LysE family translocator [Vibrio sp. OPT24]|tara:strand:+ start:1952 stop:2614 length:663 start_codon:yes stop_codon:yes gene_type:complete
MNEVTILITLASIHFIALMSPGPDFALVVQNATRHGRQTGLYIALGLSCGILLHSLLSLTGISYLVHQQPTLFAIIQLAGGSYLLYLGYGALKATWYTIQHHDDDTDSVHSTDLILTNKREAFSKGFATNILNPKALVFFISLMSSLVPADMSLSGKGFALLILFGLSLFWFSLLAWMLSTKALQKKLHEATVYIDGLCGAVFTIIGVSILWQSASSLLL